MGVFKYLITIKPGRSVLVLLILFLGFRAGYGQGGSTTAVPHFRIQQTDGQIFSYQQLKKNKPLILIYFSPDCGHCADFTGGMIKNANALKDKQIVMACWEPLQSLDVFQKKFDFSALPDLKLGSEGYTFFLQQTYQIRYFPFIAVFNAQGQLIKKLGNKAGMTNMPQLLSQLKAIKF